MYDRWCGYVDSRWQTMRAMWRNKCFVFVFVCDFLSMAYSLDVRLPMMAISFDRAGRQMPSAQDTHSLQWNPQKPASELIDSA